jgi:hypothetical protein
MVHSDENTVLSLRSSRRSSTGSIATTWKTNDGIGTPRFLQPNAVSLLLLLFLILLLIIPIFSYYCSIMICFLLQNNTSLHEYIS